MEVLNGFGVHLDDKMKMQLSYSMASWMLSQFLHGEQGALFAAAQVTEAVQFFDGGHLFLLQDPAAWPAVVDFFQLDTSVE